MLEVKAEPHKASLLKEVELREVYSKRTMASEAEQREVGSS